jgi:hypothetical protein
MLTPIFARLSNPSFVGCPPRYSVVVTSPKFDTPLSVNLRAMEGFVSVGEVEAFATCCACAVAHIVAASSVTIAKPKVFRFINGIEQLGWRSNKNGSAVIALDPAAEVLRLPTFEPMSQRSGLSACSSGT